MTKAKYTPASKKRKKRILKKAKGYFGGRRKLIKLARQSVYRGMYFAYRDRRNKKRSFRRLWIARINAACRQAGTSYNKFMNTLKKATVVIDRKNLAEMAVNDPVAFGELLKITKS